MLLGHAETVKVTYDSEILDLKALVEFFFKAIDPVSLNKQGEDEGTRYRTGVYYTTDSEREPILEVFSDISNKIGAPLAVECCPLECYFSAEEYHQDYLDKNPQGYCHLHPELFEYAKKLKRKG